MALAYLVQHGDKDQSPGDPGLTGTGKQQAAQTASWRRAADLRAVYSSPLRRARQTAEYLAAATGLTMQVDAALRERLNWDASQPLAEFLAEWDRSARDRDCVPSSGESARQAGQRLLGFLAGLPAGPQPVAAVTHGGLTIELLRTLLGDQLLPARLLHTGIPPCAITTIANLTVMTIASTTHLAEGQPSDVGMGELSGTVQSWPCAGSIFQACRPASIADRGLGNSVGSSRSPGSWRTTGPNRISTSVAAIRIGSGWTNILVGPRWTVPHGGQLQPRLQPRS